MRSRRPPFQLLILILCLIGLFGLFLTHSSRCSQPKADHASRTTHHASPLHHSSTPPLHVLKNTTNTLTQLIHSDHAILLENAFIDTTQPTPQIPDALRIPPVHHNTSDSGSSTLSSYIIQSRGPTTSAFRRV